MTRSAKPQGRDSAQECPAGSFVSACHASFILEAHVGRCLQFQTALACLRESIVNIMGKRNTHDAWLSTDLELHAITRSYSAIEFAMPRRRPPVKPYHKSNRAQLGASLEHPAALVA
jgi:hypothetical protein